MIWGINKISSVLESWYNQTLRGRMSRKMENFAVAKQFMIHNSIKKVLADDNKNWLDPVPLILSCVHIAVPRKQIVQIIKF